MHRSGCRGGRRAAMNPFDHDSCRRLRSRARLLEFLKFRVLAAQEAFFDAWRVDPATLETSTPPIHASAQASLDLQAFRQWLQPLWPEAAGLSDGDLEECLEQAERLYVDPVSR